MAVAGIRSTRGSTAVLAVVAALVAAAVLHLKVVGKGVAVGDAAAADDAYPRDALLAAAKLIAGSSEPSGWTHLASAAGLWAVFVEGDPMVATLIASVGIMIFCWVGSVTTGDYSFVDRLWSLTPWLFVAYFAARAPTGRGLVVAGLTAVWGLRLTYNFARKGGYRLGHEDYRWPALRGLMSPLAFQVFNVVFIVVYQNLLLLMIALPAYVCYLGRAVPLGPIDLVAALAFAGFLLLETAADQQQWAFQTAKWGPAPPNTADVRRGFLTEGLFASSRHPNFFAEQCLWWCVYLFSVGASGQWLNWSIVGPALLTLLFQGSTTFTEYLTLAKYPAYAEYQQCTSRLVPWPRFRNMPADDA